MICAISDTKKTAEQAPLFGFGASRQFNGLNTGVGSDYPGHGTP